MTPSWDGAHRVLRVSESGWGAVVDALATGRTAEGEGAEQLGASGFLDGLGAGDPAAQSLLAAVANPRLLTASLSYSGRSAQAWVDASTAVLALPATDEGEREVRAIDVTLLPAAWGRLVDLRPGPAVPPAESCPLDDPAQGVLHRRWELATRWTTDDGRDGGSTVAVRDTDRGWWRERDGRLEPVRATEIFRVLTALVMRRDVDGPVWARDRVPA